MNIYYFHRSPRTVAMWLDENDASLCETYTAHLCSNALQLYCGETLAHLKPFRAQFWNIHQEWAMSSFEHMTWCIDLYIALRQRNRRKEDYLFERMLWHYAHILPKTEWCNPPLVMPDRFRNMDCHDTYKWRSYYSSTARRWRKVKQPFWALAR